MQSGILPFRIQHATSVPLGKGIKFALHHRKMSTAKHRAIQILHISMFQFTFKCGYNDFISKYTDINSLHITQIDLLHNYTFCSTWFACFRCKKGSLRVNSAVILEVLLTHPELASATTWGRSYWETGQLKCRIGDVQSAHSYWPFPGLSPKLLSKWVYSNRFTVL